MIESRIEADNVSDWQRSHRKTEYEDLNKILGNSRTVNHWLRKLSIPENKPHGRMPDEECTYSCDYCFNTWTTDHEEIRKNNHHNVC